ncbi:hypothetical protein E5082_31560 [Streptomyces griseoluteus]|uniref:WD40 repeat domain-containing protein n=1 Tax=Streptomyces griseoluteus TaxID=29306 RepID=A0A4Z1CXA0_STRGP|nr:hypothetical protein [Streptomyces griseoluteus]TGN73549.1 hypothetical protein E5082_31560 [Streptomyces griseoluteus]
MTATAHLVTTADASLDLASAEAPQVLQWPGRWPLVQRGDAEVVAVGLGACGAGQGSEARFPAPWPRHFGTVTVSPQGDAAVFAGVHAVQLAEPSGVTRWEVQHGCGDGSCSVMHRSFDEYADDEDHYYADSGSVAFSADGRFVWAHVRGPLSGSEDTQDDREVWAVLYAMDGRVLGYADTMTAASSSEQTSHPDPAQMGLSIGEGEEGSPVLWGRWDGQHLSVEQIGIERILVAVSPSGQHLLTVPMGQWSLILQQVEDGSDLRKLDAQNTVPHHPRSAGADRVYWDYEAAFVDENTIVAGTSESDASHGSARHWLVDADSMTLREEISYPFPVSGPARSAGAGTWYTVSKDRLSVYLWELSEGN